MQNITFVFLPDMMGSVITEYCVHFHTKIVVSAFLCGNYSLDIFAKSSKNAGKKTTN